LVGERMSIKQVAEQRAAIRDTCRNVADQLMKIVIDSVDKLPEEQQFIVISMLMTELQIAIRKAKGD